MPPETAPTPPHLPVWKPTTRAPRQHATSARHVSMPTWAPAGRSEQRVLPSAFSHLLNPELAPMAQIAPRLAPVPR